MALPAKISSEAAHHAVDLKDLARQAALDLVRVVLVDSELQVAEDRADKERLRFSI